MRKTPIIALLGLLFIQALSFASGNAGKWIKINPTITPQKLRCSFFVNPANGWASGMNGAMAHTEDSGNTWQVQKTPRNCSIRSIFFIDENEGWAIGSQGFLYTTNGGGEWVQRNIGADSMISGYRIFFINNNIGWLSCNIIHLAYTEDGGKSWSDMSGSINNKKLNDITFVNNSLGFLCADEYLARTENGGKTWNNIDSASIIDICPFYRLQMIDTLTGYCLGRFGIAKTIDAGKTWSKVLLEFSGAAFEAMHFACADTGFALFGYDPMYLFRTNDGGANWAYRPLNDVKAPIMSVSFPEKQKGIGVADNGAIYRILGAGDSVFEITKGTGVDLKCIDFCDARHGFAGAGDIYLNDSALLYTSDGGNTWNKRETPIKSIVRLLCFDSNTVIIYCQDSTTHTLRSTDAGRNWQTLNKFDFFRSFGKIKNVQNAAYILTQNTNECFVTLDAGESWVSKGAVPLDTVNSTTSYRTATLFFLNADTTWAASYMSIRFSSNGGSTWETIYKSKDGWNFLIKDLFFSSSSIGWIVGYYPASVPTFAYIYRTDDGGRTWRRQQNITYFPDYYTGLYSFSSKIHASDDGKRAWVLDERRGILHTFDGGELWVQDTIPASPGMGFTDLTFNKCTNTLWLTSENFGIWKYEIPPENAIKHPIPANNEKNAHKILCKSNGILIPLDSYSNRVSVEVYNISGRLVFSKTLANTQKSTAVFLPLSVLPSGYYIGSVRHYLERKRINESDFSVSIIK